MYEIELHGLPDHWDRGGLKSDETRASLKRCAHQLREALKTERYVPEHVAKAVLEWYDAPPDERPSSCDLLAEVAEALRRGGP